MSLFTIIEHPMLKKDLSIIRDVNTSTELFRRAVHRISNILCVEVTKHFPLTPKEILTPLEKTIGYELSNQIVLIPILRAGLGMVNGFLELIPSAKVGHIGLQRNEETLQPVEYYFKIPKELVNTEVILLDPMLATGGSAVEAIHFIKKKEVKNLYFVCIVAAPIGVENLQKNHPDVKIFAAAVDRQLNDKGYILPGLGDAGDRTFGTL
jgi:uracil phosphoribosyltransferase